ncbi:hypothetical protein, partial [Staphylococcus pseudintermedius]|uniref:hypothetical protein n=1 Tax=Staphylococcus pseudintermedius TaxID=283734 RepID=UPI0019D4A5C6
NDACDVGIHCNYSTLYNIESFNAVPQHFVGLSYHNGKKIYHYYNCLNDKKQNVRLNLKKSL